MSCESCTGCFEATPCSAPSPSLHGHISKEYRRFLRAANVCESLIVAQDNAIIDRTATTPAVTPEVENIGSKVPGDSAGSSSKTSINNVNSTSSSSSKVDHAFSTMIGILANNQFTAQTYLSMAYRQLGPGAFLHMCRSLAQHGFWGRLVAWAFLFVKEDSERLCVLVEQQDEGLLQQVNDEAEMFEVFNPAVHCGRVEWSH